MKQIIQSSLISVIMPNYNTPIDYLKEAIDSILTQTYSNFELIIIDDASTNDSLKFIESYQDNRIVVLKNQTNKGPAYSRNRGLDIAKGKYIVIMDSDDISTPDRLEILFNYMENNPNVIVCGAWAKVFGNSISSYLFCPKVRDSENIKITLLFGCNQIMVPIINRELIEKYHIRYNNDFIAAQDYMLWVDCSQFGDFNIIPKVLYYRRMQSESITFTKSDIQEKNKWKIIEFQLNKLHFELTDKKKKYYNCIYSPKKLYDLRTKEIILELISNNITYGIYRQMSFEKYLWNRWAIISCYGLKNKKGIKNKLTILSNMPISKYHYLIKELILLIIDKVKTEWSKKN